MKINYDIDGERSLLGTCMVIEDKLMEACQALTPEYFHDIGNSIIFSCMKELYMTGCDVSLESLASRLKNRDELAKVQSALAHLRPLSNYGNFKTHLKNIQENYRKKRIADFIKTLSSNYSETSIEQIQNECSLYFNNNSNVPTYGFQEMGETEFFGYPNIEEWLTQRHKDYHQGIKINGIPTGFWELDQQLNGLNPSHYIIVAGQPGSGKTTFAIQIMKQVMEAGKKCGFLSLEMTKEQALLKFLSIETGIPFEKIIKGNLDENQKYEVLAMYYKYKNNKNLAFQDGGIDNLPSLRARVKQLVEVKKIDLLVIDYITLIRNNTPNTGTTEQIQAISSEIRSLLKELNIPGIIISQLNRSSTETGKPPMAHHLYGSGQLEKDAHEILMLHKEEFNNDRLLYLRKLRFGTADQVIRYYFDKGIFKEKTCY